MKTLLVTLLLSALTASAANVINMSGSGSTVNPVITMTGNVTFSAPPEPVADTTPPTVLSVTIDSTGTNATVLWDEAVTFGAGGSAGWVSSFGTMTYSSQPATSNALFFLGSQVYTNETGTATYTQLGDEETDGNGWEDLAGNDCASTNINVVNNSEEVAPEDASQLFYSDLEDADDDAQWDESNMPAGWSLDYAATPAPLFGTQSGSTFANGVITNITSFNADYYGTIYARMAFRCTADASATGEGVVLKLYGTDTNMVAKAAIRWNTTTNAFYRIYAGDSATEASVSPSVPVNFQDATYWFYLTYTPGTSVVAEVKDAGGTLVSEYSKTHLTSESNLVSYISVQQSQVQYFVFDNVEVRKDTSW